MMAHQLLHTREDSCTGKGDYPTSLCFFSFPSSSSSSAVALLASSAVVDVSDRSSSANRASASHHSPGAPDAGSSLCSRRKLAWRVPGRSGPGVGPVSELRFQAAASCQAGRPKGSSAVIRHAVRSCFPAPVLFF